ncbi:ATP-binding protein [bacterium]|nr:ATP-binding protein [bacterium]
MEAVILIGIQATGKTTFYEERFFNTHIRLSLDMLKTRPREMILLRACIAAKQPFVIDNTNILKADRQRYIALAKPAGFRITGYYFQSDVKGVLQRNKQRTGKAVIPVPGIFGALKRLQLPSFEEGFDKLYHVSISPSNEFVIKEWTDQPSGH